MTVSTQFSSPLPPHGDGLGLGLIPSAAFPVVFFDGSCETEVGSVVVDGTLRFSKLQSNICKRIGMSPNQISLSLVRRKKARSAAAAGSDARRKVPIDEGSDFSSIARERDCFVLATVRRSNRRGKAGRRNHVVDGRSVEVKAKDTAQAAAMMMTIRAQQQTEKKTILRRPSPELFARMSAASEINNGYEIGLWDYEAAAMMKLEMQRERYLMSTSSPVASVADPYFNRYLVNSSSCDVYLGDGAAAVICKICTGEDEGVPAAEFHWCVNDTVTHGFRSSAGPIQRPAKRHVDVTSSEA